MRGCGCRHKPFIKPSRRVSLRLDGCAPPTHPSGDLFIFSFLFFPPTAEQWNFDCANAKQEPADAFRRPSAWSTAAFSCGRMPLCTQRQAIGVSWAFSAGLTVLRKVHFPISMIMFRTSHSPQSVLFTDGCDCVASIVVHCIGIFVQSYFS